MTSDHEPVMYYWSTDTEYCPHLPEPERWTDEWDVWMCNHQMADDGPICLAAPIGLACLECSAEHGDMVAWLDCFERERGVPQNGMVPTPGVDHELMPVWAGLRECLSRECDDYFGEDGEELLGVDRCSHIHAELVCSCQRQTDGEYIIEPCPVGVRVS